MSPNGLGGPSQASQDKEQLEKARKQILKPTAVKIFWKMFCEKYTIKFITVKLYYFDLIWINMLSFFTKSYGLPIEKDVYQMAMCYLFPWDKW